MKNATALPKSLPERAAHALDTLLGSLDELAGAHLVSVLLHGSAARGGYREASSDVDLVLVLDDDDAALLAKLGPALVKARNAARIEVMILKASEIGRAADVFPVFYGDLAESAVALRGKSPFEGLELHDHHVRLRLEQELREARIRLRVAITDAAAGVLRLEGVIERKKKQLRSPLHLLARRAGAPAKSDSVRDVLDAAGALLGVDVTALHRVAEAPDQALAALTSLLDRAIDRVDREGDAA
jgi:predicted nucleotidyltransferase